MSISVDSTYIGMMGNRLELFRSLGGVNKLYNFRCPICGDSSKNAFKRRAYFYVNDSQEGYNFRCHNCEASHSLYRFIELKFPDYLKQYKMDSFIHGGNKTGRSGDVLEAAIPMAKKEVVLDGVVPLDFLPENHPAVRYILRDRQLPRHLLDKFLHVEKYVEWLSETTKEELHYKEHSRILIPFTDETGRIYRYIARSYDVDIASKYLYTDIDTGSSFYNWYHVDKEKLVYVVEGAIDAMLLPNAIAIGNAKYSRGDFDALKNYVIVPDNEPRNPHVVKSIEKAIHANHPICLWPSYIGKDINDILKNGVSIDAMVSMIQENTYSGVLARLKFNSWKRV